MPGTLNDVYELVDKQLMNGQEVLNVYHYRLIQTAYVDTANPYPSGTLIDRYIALVLPSIAACQMNGVGHVEITCRNLYNDFDADDRAISVYGNYGGGAPDVLPMFNAASFTLNTQGTVVKNGAKRLAGLVESGQTSGAITEPGLIARLAAATNAMVRTLTVGADIPTNNVFQPTIVKRIRSGTPGAYEYRLPENQGEAILAAVVSGAFKFLISSQNSRKL